MLISLIMAPVVWPDRPDVGDDYVMWSAGHIVATGGSPYDVAAWLPVRDGTPGVPNVLTDIRPENLDTMWLYPPWTAAMWAPFGALPKELGVPLLHLFLWGCTIVAALLLVRALKLREPWTVALTLAIAVSFMPLVVAAKAGHFSAVLLLGVLLFARGLERGAPTAALVAGAIVLSTKPHLFILFGAFVGASVLTRRPAMWRPFTAATAGVVGLAAAFFVRYPLPIDQFGRAVAMKRSFGDLATTSQLLGSVGTNPALVLLTIGSLAAVLAIGIAVLAPRTDRQFGEWPVIAGGLLLSLVAFPFVQQWDQALVLPALILAIAVTNRTPRAVSITIRIAVVAVGTYAWVAFFAGHIIGREFWSALTPLLAGGLLLGTLAVARPTRKE